VSTPTSSDEYVALRQTIRERGTARVVLVPLVFLGWAACAIATAAFITMAVSTLVPLLVLAAGFEAIFALHVTVERVGRYLQVFHEQEAGGWEHVAMRFGERFPGSGPDALFARLFVLAAAANFLPAALGGMWLEVAAVGVAHLALVYRILMAQRFAATQRAADLERFTALRQGGPQDR
jgi:hypothetical protein